jgi:peptidyl-prolyl cis-trans isomerase SurA
MNRRSVIIVCAVLFLAACPSPAGELLDRIVATVNGHIILQSDWDNAVRYEAFVDARPLDQLPATERKAALDRLIDQELLRQQMRSSEFQRATPQEVTQRVQEIRQLYAEAQDDEGWFALLRRYGLSPEELTQHVALQLDLMRLVDARLRPNVSIDSKSIESYYNQELLPQLRQSGAKEVPLAEVSPRIKELLTQQKLNQLLVAWLQNLRSGSEIQTDPIPEEARGEAR